MTLSCKDCADYVTWFAVGGRTFLYSPDVEVSVPDDLELPTCTLCRKVHLYGNAGALLLLEVALRPEYERLRKERVNFAVTRLKDIEPELQISDIASLCGVTEGLWSKVLSGEKVATPMLIRLLESFCLHPEDIERHLDNIALQDLLEGEHSSVI